MRILLICPIPLEFTTCKSALGLKDGPRILGCRSAVGTISSTDITALESGPAKARAASAAVAGIGKLSPDAVLDTGTCAALDGRLIVNSVILGISCIEYDISGTGLPRSIIPEMKLPSAFSFLPRRDADTLVRSAVEAGKDRGTHVRVGIQACGEFFIQSTEVRESLASLTGALAANWETAGVFVSALRASVPPMSIRIVTDLGDESSHMDFNRNVKKCAQELYQYLRALIESGWLEDFQSQWRRLTAGQIEKMPQTVLP